MLSLGLGTIWKLHYLNKKKTDIGTTDGNLKRLIPRRVMFGNLKRLMPRRVMFGNLCIIVRHTTGIACTLRL